MSASETLDCLQRVVNGHRTTAPCGQEPVTEEFAPTAASQAFSVYAAAPNFDVLHFTMRDADQLHWRASRSNPSQFGRTLAPLSEDDV
jgi:hypothetical protein